MAKSKRKSRNKNNLTPIWISAFLLIISVFALTRWGFVGELSFNFFNFFFGNMTIPLALVTVVYAAWYLMTREMIFKKNPRRLIGLGIILLSILIMQHAFLFNDIINSQTNIIQSTWRFYLNDIQAATPAVGVGGGIIGALFYGLSYFLFDQVGTFIVLFILLVFGILWLFDIPLAAFFGMIYTGIQKTYQGIVNFFKNSQNKAKEKPKVKKKAKPKKKTTTPTASKEKPVAEPPSIEEEKAEPQQQELIFDPLEKPYKEDSKEEVDNSPEVEENMAFEEDDDNEDYILPAIDLLNPYQPADQSNEEELMAFNQQKLQETFESFGVEAEVVDVTLGPAVTKYAIKPATGVKVSKIVNLQNDLALALAAKDIRIEAPIPGQALIGIEVPNQDVSFVPFKEVMEGTSRNPAKLLEIPLGKDINGEIVSADLSKMPHLLIAGATGSGKSVGINGIITALLMRTKPNEVKLMLVDPKKVELNVYNGVPHLLTPVVTNPKKAARALNNVVKEMERRYELFAESGSRNRESYNQYAIKHNQETGDNIPRLPHIVVIVDELADLMMVASKEVEDAIMRLAQMARAAGIHMVLATQRPSVDVLTGTIKANIPSRIAFSVTSGTDSRTILDMTGAEKLIGKGDMLFIPMGQNQPTRVQGSFISDEEVEHVVDFVKDQQSANYVEEMIPSDKPEPNETEEPEDELFDEVVEFIIQEKKCSISLLQRHFRIGYNRAARIVDDLEDRGYVGPQKGSKPREVYIRTTNEETEENEPIANEEAEEQQPINE